MPNRSDATSLDWTRTGDPFPARFDDVCPNPDCPNDGVIAPGERIVKLAKLKHYTKSLEGMQGRRYDKRVTLEHAHVGCTVEPEPEPEWEEPVCECGASLVVDGEVRLRCSSCER